MLRFFLSITLASLLTACGGAPITLPYKENVTKASVNRQMLRCEVEAVNAVPANVSTYTTPKITTPVQCDTSPYTGDVTCTGGQTVGGNLVSEDLNANLRNRYIEQCLIDSGFTMLAYEQCSSDVKRAAIASRANKPQDMSMPLIVANETICVFTHAGKTWYADINNPERSL